MILEVAEIDIRAGQAHEFEVAMDEALDLLAQSHGFCGARLLKSQEIGNRYRLLVKWERIEDHITRWQNSEAFQKWRSLIQPHFESIPNVEHMEVVLERLKQYPDAR